MNIRRLHLFPSSSVSKSTERLTEQNQTCNCFPPFDLRMETDLASETLCYVSCFVKILHCREFHMPIKSYRCIDLDRSLGLQEVEAPRISRQSPYKGSKIVSTKHQPPPPPAPRYLWYLIVGGWVDPSGIMKWRMKNPNDPIGNQTRGLS
jgi:hypothetical protein